MATDTEVWAQVVEYVEWLDDYEQAAAALTVTNHNAIKEALKGEYTPGVLEVIQTSRNDIAGPLSTARLREGFKPFLQEFAEVYGWDVNPEEAQEIELLRLLRQQMTDDSDSLNSNEHTIDASFSGSTTGTGTLHRLTVDRDGNEISGILPGGTQTFKVIQDARGGLTGGADKHAEIWRYSAGDRDKDALTWTGTGVRFDQLVTANAKNTERFALNASFEQNDAAGSDDVAPGSDTAVTSWTLNAAASWKLRTNDTYRGYPGSQNTTLYSLEAVVNNATCTQILQNTNAGVNYDEDVPYFAQIAVKDGGSGDGTARLRHGAQTATQAVSGASSWTALPIAVGTGCWFANFNEADMDVQFGWESGSTGSVLYDDLVIEPFTWVPGLGWIVVVGGATPWIAGDSKTLTDAFGSTRARIDYWLARAYWELVDEMGGWFPTATGGTESIDTGN